MLAAMGGPVGVSAAEIAAALRRLARHQWVRAQGSPRVTVLACPDVALARALWSQWLGAGRDPAAIGAGDATAAGSPALEEAPGAAGLDGAIRIAAARAIADPAAPSAVIATPAALAAWRAGRTDRLAAMVDEGLIAIAAIAAPAAPPGRGAAAAAPPGRGAAPAARRGSAAPARSARSGGAIAGRRARGSGDPPSAPSTGVARGPALFDARSAAEAALLEALEATPATAGRFELNARLPVRFGGAAAEVDLLARADRIAIEVDGYYHFADLDAYRRDRRKDLALQLAGLIVLRVHAQDVMRDARPAVAAVCQALAARLEAAARGPRERRGAPPEARR
jgi:very-short-patch-repair endonuclease